jgi:hypothetical protein
LITLGSWVIKRGFRHFVDPLSRRDKSYFRLGCDWLWNASFALISSFISILSLILETDMWLAHHLLLRHYHQCIANVRPLWYNRNRLFWRPNNLYTARPHKLTEF